MRVRVCVRVFAFDERARAQLGGVRLALLNYQEHSRTHDKWARECRGLVAAYTPGIGWLPLSVKLQRGSEMLTSLHTAFGIEENESFARASGCSHLHRVQQHTVQRCAEGGELLGVLSSKVDGALLCVNIYPDGSPQAALLRRLVACESAAAASSAGEGHGAEAEQVRFARASLDACDGLGFIFCLGTRGTLLVGPAMLEFVVGAVCGGVLNAAVTNREHSPACVWETAARPFARRLAAFREALPAAERERAMTLSFEAVCAHRRTPWGSPHPELAVSYPRDMVRFLGATLGIGGVGAAGRFRCHAQLAHAATAAGLEQPLHWLTHSVEAVDAMLQDLDCVVRATITPSEYLRRHPPAVAPLAGSEPLLDVEGFVFLRPLVSASQAAHVAWLLREGRADEAAAAIAEVDLDYGKLKTVAYYKAHNLEKAKEKEKEKARVAALRAYPRVAGRHFPIIERIHAFYDGEVGQEGSGAAAQLQRVSVSLRALLHAAQAAETAEALGEQMSVGGQGVAASGAALGAGWLDGKRARAWASKPSARCRMLINTRDSGWAELARAVLGGEIPCLQNLDDAATRAEVDSLIHELVNRPGRGTPLWQMAASEELTVGESTLARLCLLCLRLAS